MFARPAALSAPADPGPPAAIAPPAEPAAFGRGDLRAIALGWERLRVVYNVVLAGLCSPLALLRGPDVYAAPAFWGNCVAGAVLANVLFFAGPLTEAYVDWLGLRHPAVRWALFAVGLLASLAFAAASVWAFPEVVGPI